jgi:hypothetical protein
LNCEIIAAQRPEFAALHGPTCIITPATLGEGVCIWNAISRAVESAGEFAGENLQESGAVPCPAISAKPPLFCPSAAKRINKLQSDQRADG